MKKSIDKSAMIDVMDGIVAAADRDRKQNSIVYRDLVAVATDDRQTIFSVYELAVSDAYLAMSHVIREKYGISRISDDLYNFIKDYPVRIDRISDDIKRVEGRACCVDKAWSRLMAEFDQLVKDNLEQQS